MDVFMWIVRAFFVVIGLIISIIEWKDGDKWGAVAAILAAFGLALFPFGGYDAICRALQ